MAIENDNEHFF